MIGRYNPEHDVRPILTSTIEYTRFLSQDFSPVCCDKFTPVNVLAETPDYCSDGRISEDQQEALYTNYLEGVTLEELYSATEQLQDSPSVGVYLEIAKNTINKTNRIIKRISTL